MDFSSNNQNSNKLLKFQIRKDFNNMPKWLPTNPTILRRLSLSNPMTNEGHPALADLALADLAFADLLVGYLAFAD
jgi:hypothetical protein